METLVLFEGSYAPLYVVQEITGLTRTELEGITEVIEIEPDLCIPDYI